MMWLSGFLIAYAIGRHIRLRDQHAFREALIAIYKGKAEPDENGRVGWLLGVCRRMK